MTFSRPAIERLIATVESGLQYGELGPYAQALRDCLLAIEARDAIESASQRTIESGNEAFRVMRNEWHRDRDRLRAEVARLTAERDAISAASLPDRKEWDMMAANEGRDTESSDYVDGWNAALDEIGRAAKELP